MNINETLTDRAIEIIGHVDRILKLAPTSLSPREREGIRESAKRIESIVSEIQRIVGK